MMLNPEELQELFMLIKKNYGYDFSEYAEASFNRRVQYFMNLHRMDTLAQLGGALLENKGLFEEFVEKTSVNVTAMFRDPGFYKSLRKNVLTRLATYPFIRIWIAGCSTGEEVYSLAILLREEKLEKKSIIYATDINRRSLRLAADGIYSLINMQEYTANYLKADGTDSFSDYYKAKYDYVLFDRSLKKNMVFAVHNLIADKSFNEFHLIICRNVLIYFKQELQNKVINLFYESLSNFGFLCLGNKESLLFADKKKYFSEIDKKEKIFMKQK